MGILCTIPSTKSLGKLAEKNKEKSFLRISLLFENDDSNEREESGYPSFSDINGGRLWDGSVHSKDCAALTSSPKSPKKPFTVFQDDCYGRTPYNLYVRNNQDVYAVQNFRDGEDEEGRRPCPFYTRTLPEFLEEKRPSQNQIKFMIEEEVPEIAPENQMMHQRNKDVMEEE